MPEIKNNRSRPLLCSFNSSISCVVRQVAPQRLDQSACRNCDRFHDAFACNHQEVSYAKWSKNNHECAPTQTGSVICCTLEAVDIEYRSPRAEELPKRAKKL
jgi:hypothetical protein